MDDELSHGEKSLSQSFEPFTPKRSLNPNNGIYLRKSPNPWHPNQALQLSGVYTEGERGVAGMGGGWLRSQHSSLVALFFGTYLLRNVQKDLQKELHFKISPNFWQINFDGTPLQK